jgi:hypothetical protein
MAEHRRLRFEEEHGAGPLTGHGRADYGGYGDDEGGARGAAERDREMMLYAGDQASQQTSKYDPDKLHEFDDRLHGKGTVVTHYVEEPPGNIASYRDTDGSAPQYDAHGGPAGLRGRWRDPRLGVFQMWGNGALSPATLGAFSSKRCEIVRAAARSRFSMPWVSAVSTAGACDREEMAWGAATGFMEGDTALIRDRGETAKPRYQAEPVRVSAVTRAAEQVYALVSSCELATAALNAALCWNSGVPQAHPCTKLDEAASVQYPPLLTDLRPWANAPKLFPGLKRAEAAVLSFPAAFGQPYIGTRTSARRAESDPWVQSLCMHCDVHKSENEGYDERSRTRVHLADGFEVEYTESAAGDPDVDPKLTDERARARSATAADGGEVDDLHLPLWRHACLFRSVDGLPEALAPLRSLTLEHHSSQEHPGATSMPALDVAALCGSIASLAHLEELFVRLTPLCFIGHEVRKRLVADPESKEEYCNLGHLLAGSDVAYGSEGETLSGRKRDSALQDAVQAYLSAQMERYKSPTGLRIAEDRGAEQLYAAVRDRIDAGRLVNVGLPFARCCLGLVLGCRASLVELYDGCHSKSTFDEICAALRVTYESPIAPLCAAQVKRIVAYAPLQEYRMRYATDVSFPETVEQPMAALRGLLKRPMDGSDWNFGGSVFELNLPPFSSLSSAPAPKKEADDKAAGGARGGGGGGGGDGGAPVSGGGSDCCVWVVDYGEDPLPPGHPDARKEAVAARRDGIALRRTYMIDCPMRDAVVRVGEIGASGNKRPEPELLQQIPRAERAGDGTFGKRLAQAMIPPRYIFYVGGPNACPLEILYSDCLQEKLPVITTAPATASAAALVRGGGSRAELAGENYDAWTASALAATKHEHVGVLSALERLNVSERTAAGAEAGARTASVVSRGAAVAVAATARARPTRGHVSADVTVLRRHPALWAFVDHAWAVLRRRMLHDRRRTLHDLGIRDDPRKPIASLPREVESTINAIIAAADSMLWARGGSLDPSLREGMSAEMRRNGVRKYVIDTAFFGRGPETGLAVRG